MDVLENPRDRPYSSESLGGTAFKREGMTVHRWHHQHTPRQRIEVDPNAGKEPNGHLQEDFAFAADLNPGKSLKSKKEDKSKVYSSKKRSESYSSKKRSEDDSSKKRSEDDSSKKRSEDYSSKKKKSLKLESFKSYI